MPTLIYFNSNISENLISRKLAPNPFKLQNSAFKSFEIFVKCFLTVEKLHLKSQQRNEAFPVLIPWWTPEAVSRFHSVDKIIFQQIINKRSHKRTFASTRWRKVCCWKALKLRARNIFNDKAKCYCGEKSFVFIKSRKSLLVYSKKDAKSCNLENLWNFVMKQYDLDL